MRAVLLACLLSSAACLHFEETFLEESDAGTGMVDAADTNSVDAADEVSELSLTVSPAQPRVFPDSTVDFAIEIARVDADSVGDAIVSLEGDLPTGVSANPAVIPASASSGTLTVTIGAEADLGSIALTIGARIAATDASGRAPAKVLIAGPAGTIDPSFAEAGTLTSDIADTILGIAVAPTERIFVATRKDGVTNIVALTESGALDTTFATTGILALAGLSLGDILPRDAGGVMVVGTVNNEATVQVYDASGALDTTFQGGGVFAPQAGMSRSGQSIAVAADNRIFIAGRDSSNTAAIYRFSASGLFEGFAQVPQGRSSEFISIGIAPNGDILALGGFSGAPRALVARFDADALEPIFTFGDTVGTAVVGSTGVSPKSMTVAASGEIVITMTAISEPEAFHISLLAADGMSVVFNETKVAPAPDSDSAVDASGRILAVTTGVNLGTGSPLADLYRFTSTGNDDSSFASNGRMRLTATDNTVTFRLFSMGLQPDGRILVGGTRNSDWALQRYWD
tara:strand:- start:92973 stop:94514 length:1542 start_codon:yes stop_codon:yes gene_type:complete